MMEVHVALYKLIHEDTILDALGVVPWHVSLVFMWIDEVLGEHLSLEVWYDGNGVDEKPYVPGKGGWTGDAKFHSLISCGSVVATLTQIKTFLEVVRAQWPAGDYHRLGPNCQDYVSQVLKVLRLQELPNFVTRAPWLGRAARTVADYVIGLDEAPRFVNSRDPEVAVRPDNVGVCPELGIDSLVTSPTLNLPPPPPPLQMRRSLIAPLPLNETMTTTVREPWRSRSVPRSMSMASFSEDGHASKSPLLRQRRERSTGRGTSLPRTKDVGWCNLLMSEQHASREKGCVCSTHKGKSERRNLSWNSRSHHRSPGPRNVGRGQLPPPRQMCPSSAFGPTWHEVDRGQMRFGTPPVPIKQSTHIVARTSDARRDCNTVAGCWGTGSQGPGSHHLAVGKSSLPSTSSVLWCGPTLSSKVIPQPLSMPHAISPMSQALSPTLAWNAAPSLSWGGSSPPVVGPPPVATPPTIVGPPVAWSRNGGMASAVMPPDVSVPRAAAGAGGIGSAITHTSSGTVVSPKVGTHTLYNMGPGPPLAGVWKTAVASLERRRVSIGAST